MPRVAKHGEGSPKYEQAVSMLKEGSTAREVKEATGLTEGQIQTIKAKAGLKGTGTKKGGRPSGSGKAKTPAKKDPRVFGGDGPNLSFFFEQVKPKEEEEPSENKQLLELMEELSGIEDKLNRSEQTTKALTLAKAWWNTRIDLVKAGENDPGVTPIEGWTPEWTPEPKATQGKKKGSKK